MSQLNVSLPSDGDTIDSSDYNTPINTIVTDYNGNIDNSNIAAAAAIAGTKLADGGITNAKLSTSAGEVGGAWLSFTPTLGNFTLGSGTKTGVYTKQGTTIRGEIQITFGTSMAFGTGMTVDLPVTAATRYANSGSYVPIGSIIFFDNTTALYSGKLVLIGSSTTAQVRYDVASGTNLVLTSTSASTPMTLATGDTINIQFQYEAA